MADIVYRNELKFFLNSHTSTILKSRISSVMRPDAFGKDGVYTVHSLYLDDQYDTFLHEKTRNSFSRTKYRTRHYNGDLSAVRLERKRKDGERSYKQSIKLTKTQYENIKSGNLDFILLSEIPLLMEIANIHRLRRLRPAAVFQYTREAYVYAPGNVRLTFDKDIRQARACPEPDGRAPPGLGGMLEVKFDQFIPDVVKEMLHGLPLARTEMSKYSYSRARRL